MSGISSVTSKPFCNEYQLEGGVTIRDKTNGIPRAAFSEKLTAEKQRPSYEIFIHGKKTILPIFPEPKSEDCLWFVNCLKISLKKKTDLSRLLNGP